MEKIRISLFKEDIKELEENVQDMSEREQTIMFAYGKNVEEYGKAMQDLTKDVAKNYTKEQPNGKTSTPYGTIDYQDSSIAMVTDLEAIDKELERLGSNKRVADFKKEQLRSDKVVTHTTFKA
jgi:hypothetical protein